MVGGCMLQAAIRLARAYGAVGCIVFRRPGLRRQWNWGLMALIGAFCAISPNASSAAEGTIELSTGVLFYDKPALDEVRAQDAARVWPRLAPLIAQQFDGRPYSGVLFAYLPWAGSADFRSAEWVFAAVAGGARDRAATLMRFTFAGLTPIAMYATNLRGESEIDSAQAATIIDSGPLRREPYQSRGALEMVDGFFFYVANPTDFGGAEVLTREGGKLIFAATSVYDGRGRLLFPNEQAPQQ